jgi:CheY-like chemotaxis protein
MLNHIIEETFKPDFPNHVSTAAADSRTEASVVGVVMKILVVDDDPTFRTLLQKLLNRLRLHDYDIAVDGQNAIDSFKELLSAGVSYSLIFLDVKMPRKDGIDTLKEIRTIEREMHLPPEKITKIIMTTGTDDDATLANAYDALCDGYVVKPYDYSTIISQLQVLGFDVSDN